jgi:hypothetical protein
MVMLLSRWVFNAEGSGGTTWLTEAGSWVLVLILCVLHLTFNWIVYAKTQLIPADKVYQSREARTFLYENVYLWCGGLLGFHHLYRKRWWPGLLYILTAGGFGLLFIRDLTRISSRKPACLQRPPPAPYSGAPPPPSRSRNSSKKPTHPIHSFLALAFILSFPTVLIADLLPLPFWASVFPAFLLSLAGYFLICSGIFVLKNLKHPERWRMIPAIPKGFYTQARLLPRSVFRADLEAARRCSASGMCTHPVLNVTLLQSEDTKISPTEIETTLRSTLTAFQTWSGRSDLSYPEGFRLLYFSRHREMLKYLRPFGKIPFHHFIGLYIPLYPHRIVLAEEWNLTGADQREHIIAHEAVHALHLPACRDLFSPPWIMEGLSQLMARNIRPEVLRPSSFLHRAQANGILLSGTDLIRPRQHVFASTSPSGLLDVSIFYLQAEMLFLWLDTHHHHVLQTAAFTSSVTSPRTFEEAFDCSPDEAMDLALKSCLNATSASEPPSKPLLLEQITRTLHSPESTLHEQAVALAYTLRLPAGEAVSILNRAAPTLHPRLHQDSQQLLHFLS